MILDLSHRDGQSIVLRISAIGYRPVGIPMGKIAYQMNQYSHLAASVPVCVV